MNLSLPTLRRSARLVPVLLLAAAPAAAQGRLWVVDSGGVGDFTTIQPAIDAASGGDTVLVQSYTALEPLVIDGKSLVITGVPTLSGENGPLITGLTVTNLAAGQLVTVQGLNVDGPVNLAACDGTIRLEQVLDQYTVFPLVNGPNATVDDCAAVVLVDCLFDVQGVFSNPDAMPALLIQDSNVLITDLTVPEPGQTVLPANCSPGAAGVEIQSGTVLLSGCRINGGRGASCTQDDMGTQGGPAIRLGSGSPTVTVAGCVLTGGPGGTGVAGDGASGPPSEVQSGTLTTLEGPARILTSETRVQGGSSFVLSVQGEPGDVLLGAYSTGSALAILPRFAGGLALVPPLGLFPIGTIDATGQISVTLPTAPVPPLVSSTFYFQALAFTAEGTYLLSSTATLVVLP